MRDSRYAVAVALLVALPAAAQERAGVSAAVRGEVVLASTSQGAQVVGRQARGGEAIYLGDQIRSGADSGMQIMLLDETTFTVGPDSQITVDEFVYDPGTGGRLAVSIARGAFRFVTGRIAKAEPRNMEVRTPAGTIGIRGTIVYGRIVGDRMTVALGGPGGTNNAGAKRGGFDFTPTGGGPPIEVRRPGWAVVIETGQPPRAIELPRERLDALAAALEARAPAPPLVGAVPGAGALAGRPAFGPGAVQRARTASGQGTAAASDSLLVLNDFLLPALDFESLALTVNMQTFSGLGDITTFGQLMSLTSGTGTYAQAGVGMINISTLLPDGSYDFNLSINFGARTYTGGFNNISVPSLSVVGQSVALTLPDIPAPGSYAGVVPPLTESIAPFAGTNSACPIAGTTCQGVVLLQNQGGVVAKSAFHTLSVTNGPNGAVGQGVASRP